MNKIISDIKLNPKLFDKDMKCADVKINKIVESLKPYKPERVVLFGSYAWGRPTKDSDIDLFIVKNTRKSRYQRIPEARSCLYDIDGAFDILVMTPSEVKKKLSAGDFFVSSIIAKGRTLYDKTKR